MRYARRRSSQLVCSLRSPDPPVPMCMPVHMPIISELLPTFCSLLCKPHARCPPLSAAHGLCYVLALDLQRAIAQRLRHPGCRVELGVQTVRLMRRRSGATIDRREPHPCARVDTCSPVSPSVKVRRGGGSIGLKWPQFGHTLALRTEEKTDRSAVLVIDAT
ncbi:hypothetical protein VTI74DRAFT_1137 [Chaetomium olivicolor]